MTDRAEVAPSEGAQAATLEVGSLAREMARAYVSMVRFHREQMNLDQSQSDVNLEQKAAFLLARLPEEPADGISWLTLGLVAEREPDLAHATWNRIKDEARDELDSGHSAALALDWHREPWKRAQFLAIRQAFIDEWQPRGGIEGTLIDTMAQAHTMYLLWLSRAHVQAVTEGEIDEHKHREYGYWRPPRVDAAAAMDQAAAMADRYNKLFLRSLRALRDLRRYATSVIVQNAGQVNLAGQQVNVSHGIAAGDQDSK